MNFFLIFILLDITCKNCWVLQVQKVYTFKNIPYTLACVNHFSFYLFTLEIENIKYTVIHYVEWSRIYTSIVKASYISSYLSSYISSYMASYQPLYRICSTGLMKDNYHQFSILYYILHSI